MSKKQFAVIGLGRFGESVVKILVENGKSVEYNQPLFEIKTS